MPHGIVSRLFAAACLSLATLSAAATDDGAHRALSADHIASRYGAQPGPAHAAHTRSVAFPTRVFRALLQDPNATGIYAEFVAMPDDGAETLLLRATDRRGRPFGTAYELGKRCPPYCNDIAGATASDPQALKRAGVALDPAQTEAFLDAAQRRRATAPGANSVGVQWRREVFERLLAQPGAAGIVAAFVRHPESGRDVLLLRAVDRDGRAFGPGFDDGRPCPGAGCAH
jgi:hypothetical protein